MKELEKTYSPEKIEGRIYKKWLEEKYFQAKVNKDKKPFTIIMRKAGLLSVTGDDEAADALDALMAQDGVASYLMRDKQIATTVKLRVVARNQQLIRLDFEEHPNREVLEQIKQQYREILPEYDAIIFSDYGKGGLSHIFDMIDWAKHAGKTVLIDPKGDDYEKYAGATLITPNRNYEIGRASCRERV